MEVGGKHEPFILFEPVNIVLMLRKILGFGADGDGQSPPSASVPVVPPVNTPEATVSVEEQNMAILRHRIDAKPGHTWTYEEQHFMMTGGLIGYLTGWTPASRARRAPKPQPPFAHMRTAEYKDLSQLRRDQIWSLAEALHRLGPLQPLEAAKYIRLIHTGAGRGVVLGAQGYRLLNLKPQALRGVSRLTDLVYLRAAAQHHHWTIVRLPSRRHGSRIGKLDRLGVATRDGQTIRVLARCTDGGYSRRTVDELFAFLRSGLMADDTPLVVVTPYARQAGRRRKHDEYLEIVVFPTPRDASRSRVSS